MQETHARFLRLQLQWRYIEPTDQDPPVYGWSEVDALVADLDPGFHTVANLVSAPSWASSTICGPVDLAPLQRWQDFVRAAVERYDGDGVDDAPGSPVVTAWEIGNEQDFDLQQAGGEGDYGSCFGGAFADDYARHLRAAWLGAKAADPEAQVWFGGVAYDRFHNKADYIVSHRGPFDYGFTRDALTTLWQDHGTEDGYPFFDGIGLHIYNDFRDNWDGLAPFDQELIGKVEDFREEMLVDPGKYDHRSRPLYLTEISLPSMPEDQWTLRSEALQAIYPGQMLARAITAGVAGAIWFSAEDHRTGACDQPYDWWGFGLLRSLDVYQAMQACATPPVPGYSVSEDHEPKPAHAALRVAVEALGRASYETQLTAAQTGSSQTAAFRFVDHDGTRVLAAFTDNGARLGAKSSTPATVIFRVTASLLPGWTGEVEVTDHLGKVTVLAQDSQGRVTLILTQEPLYIRPHGD